MTKLKDPEKAKVLANMEKDRKNLPLNHSLNCDQTDKISNCEQTDKISNCEQTNKISNCDQTDKIRICDQTNKISNCDQTNKIRIGKLPESILASLSATNPQVPAFQDSVRIEFDEVRGRYGVATRDLQPGEVVLQVTGFSLVSETEYWLLIGHWSLISSIIFNHNPQLSGGSSGDDAEAGAQV